MDKKLENELNNKIQIIAKWLTFHTYDKMGAIEIAEMLDDIHERMKNEINNSISKDIIQDKIDMRKFELQQQYKDFENDLVLKTLEGLLSGNDYSYEEDDFE